MTGTKELNKSVSAFVDDPDTNEFEQVFFDRVKATIEVINPAIASRKSMDPTMTSIKTSLFSILYLFNYFCLLYVTKY